MNPTNIILKYQTAKETYLISCLKITFGWKRIKLLVLVSVLTRNMDR